MSEEEDIFDTHYDAIFSKHLTILVFEFELLYGDVWSIITMPTVNVWLLSPYKRLNIYIYKTESNTLE